MSLSDDEKNKVEFEKCIDRYHDYAKEHENYCRSNCYNLIDLENDGFLEYPHTRKCKDMASMHCNSFVECKSTYCLKYNDERDLVPSYRRLKKKKPLIAGSMFLEYSENQEDYSS